MREVAWVVFDEIHYMRDAGTYQIQFGKHLALLQEPLISIDTFPAGIYI